MDIRRVSTIAGACIACARTPAVPSAPPANGGEKSASICPSSSTKPSSAERDYVPRVASSVAVQLPPVPALPARAERVGRDFTAWGASSALRNRFDRNSVTQGKVWITGYIVHTNLGDAPRCAVHRGGVADPPDCKPPIPAFWIGDEPGAALADSIKVMGWASNFAQIHDALRAYAKRTPEPYLDQFWGIEIPNPLPAKGAKVRVNGSFSAVFTRASTGIEADPIMGILTYESMVVLERAPTPAKLPGMRP